MVIAVWLLACGGETVAHRTSAVAMLAELEVRVLTDAERALVEQKVIRIESLGGSVEHVRNTLWVAATHGCRGVCLVHVIADLEVGLEQHLGDGAAADRALARLRGPRVDLAMGAHAAPTW